MAFFDKSQILNNLENLMIFRLKLNIKIKMMITTSYIWFIFLIYSVICKGEDLLKLILKIEGELKKRASFIETSFQNRCSTTCKPSYNGCSTKLPEMTCNQKYIRDECKCYEQGSLISQNDSLILLLNPNSEPTQEISETICYLQGLEPLYLKAEKEFQFELNQYTGTSVGVHKTYPGKFSCNYDPRYRPWFIAAATGAKNLIIIIDNSASMEIDALNGAKTAAKFIIDGLTIADRIGVVVFNTQATSITNTLLRAKLENRDSLKKSIDALNSTGATNYEAAFAKSYEIISNSKSDEYGGLSCQTIFLFLTDGVPTNGETNIENLKNILNSLEAQYKVNATLISYSFGSTATIDSLTALSCLRNGFVQYVPFIQELKEKMSSYYILLSSGITRDSVVWTEPYLDAFGFGMKITATMPFYDRVNSARPRFLGATSIDIDYKEFLKYDEAESLIRQLVERSSGCTKLTLNFCDMQNLRESNYKCPSTTVCPIQTFVSKVLCPSFTQPPFVENTTPYLKPTEYQYCCGTYSCGKLTGIIAGSVAGGIALIIGVFFLVKSQMAKGKKSSDKNNNNQPGKIEMIITNHDEIKRLSGKDVQKKVDIVNNNIEVGDKKVDFVDPYADGNLSVPRLA